MVEIKIKEYIMEELGYGDGSSKKLL